MAPPSPSDYPHLTLGSLTVKDLSARKRFSNVGDLYPFFLPLLMCMEREEEFVLLCLPADKIDSDFDEAQPFRSVWS